MDHKLAMCRVGFVVFKKNGRNLPKVPEPIYFSPLPNALTFKKSKSLFLLDFFFK